MYILILYIYTHTHTRKKEGKFPNMYKTSTAFRQQELWSRLIAIRQFSSERMIVSFNVICRPFIPFSLSIQFPFLSS